jgi:nucleoside-diphosphate-sugar epimerase
MSRRILITGGAGFVGAVLTRTALAHGADVALLVRPTTDLWRLADVLPHIYLINGDLGMVDSYRAAIQTYQPDICFHLAWVTEPGKYGQSPLNAAFMLQTIDFLRVLAEAGCRQIIATGTCLEYQLGAHLLSEDTALQYNTPYAATKNFTAQLGADEAKRLGIDFVWARLFYMYGKGDHPKRLIPSLIASLRAGLLFKTTDGTQFVDYLNVEDVAAGLWSLQGQRGVFNVCSGVPVAVREVVLQLGELMGRPELIQLGALPRIPDISPLILGSHDKITAATGWTPQTALADGLRALVKSK